MDLAILYDVALSIGAKRRSTEKRFRTRRFKRTIPMTLKSVLASSTIAARVCGMLAEEPDSLQFAITAQPNAGGNSL